MKAPVMVVDVVRRCCGLHEPLRTHSAASDSAIHSIRGVSLGDRLLLEIPADQVRLRAVLIEVRSPTMVVGIACGSSEPVMLIIVRVSELSTVPTATAIGLLGGMCMHLIASGLCRMDMRVMHQP